MRRVMVCFLLFCAGIRIESMMKKSLSATSFLCAVVLLSFSVESAQAANAPAGAASPPPTTLAAPDAPKAESQTPPAEAAPVGNAETPSAEPPVEAPPPPPPPTNLELGMAALSQQSYAEAFKFLNEAAKEGEAIAQFELGRLYLSGQGVKANPARAFTLLQTAAEQGIEAAEIMVANALRTGTGVKKDIPQAVRWYREAALRNDANALAALAALYKEDQDLALLDPAAARILEPLAKSGDIAAQRMLALVLQIGALPDEKAALEWLYRAAFAGSAPARLELADALRHASFENHGAEAMDWVALAVRQGDPAANYQMAMAYLNGLFRPLDGREGILWLQRAAVLGDADALATLGDFYARGAFGLAKDPEWAWLLLDAAAIRGSASATKERDALSKDMPAKQVSVLKAQSKKWQDFWLPKNP